MEDKKETGEKKFYWLKLKAGFFKRHDILIIEDLPNGEKYLIFYLKLLLESLDHEGCLRYNDRIPYNETMLASVTNTDIDIVRSAMQIFLNMDLVEIWEDKTIFMRGILKLIGSESESAERVRLYRERKKLATQRALQCNTTVTESNTERDIDEDIDIDSNPPTPARVGNEIEGMKEFIERFNINIDGYNGTLADIDFNLLIQFYEKSKTFLQVRPFAKNLKWICKNYTTILTGQYNDFEDKPTTTKKGKGAERERGTDILKNLFNQAAAEEDANGDGAENKDGKP